LTRQGLQQAVHQSAKELEHFLESFIEEYNKYAEKCRSSAQAAMAQMFLAKEEVRAGSPLASSAYQKAVEAMKNRSEPEVKLVFESLSAFAEQRHPARLLDDAQANLASPNFSPT
jgi:hypothetical protein